MKWVLHMGAYAAATGVAVGVLYGQPVQSLGSSPRAEVTEVLATGVFYPRIGTMRSLGNFEVTDSCWLGVALIAQQPGTDNLREVLATGPHKVPLAPVAEGGSPLAGTTMTPPRLQAFSNFRMARNGAVTFVANFTEAGVSGTGLFSQPTQAGPARLLARNQRSAPGMPDGVLYQGLANSPVMDPSGAMTFVAALSGPTISSPNDRAVYLATGGPAQLLFTEGAPIPSLGGRSISFLNDTNSTPTSFGPSRVFTALLGAPGTPAILAGMPLTQVASRDDTLPNEPGVQYSEFLPGPSVGYGFEIAFTATLRGNRVDPTNNWAIVSNSRQVLVRAGQQAPGLPVGTRLHRFSTPLLYSNANHLLFHASLQGPDIGDLNRTALFAGQRESIALIVRSGSQAPGCPAGVLIGPFSEQFNNDPVFVNQRGDIIFRTQLRGPGVTSSNDFALFAYSARHGLQLVAREGDSIRIAGATRTIQIITIPDRTGAVSQSNGRDGRRTILNAHGECFFAVRCTDGVDALLKAQVNDPPCPADFDGDHFVDCFDYVAFVIAFEAGEPAADQDEDGFIDAFDYEAFVEAFETDC